MLVVFWVAPEQKRYILQTEKIHNRLSADEIRSFEDLNADGESELIRSFKTTSGNHAISIESIDSKIYNQWNFRGDIPNSNIRYFTGDFDSDGLKEVYVFTQTNDTVWLHYFNPFKTDGVERYNIFVDKVNSTDGKIDYYIASPQLADINGDGSVSVIFSLRAGYSIQPRRIYRYDILTDSMYSSATSGISHYELLLHDINQDGNTEIISTNFATGNLRKRMNIPYSDSSAWLAVYDHRLEYVFEPIGFEGFTMHVYCIPYQTNNGNYLLVFNTNASFIHDYSKIYLIDSEGKTISKKKHPMKYIPKIYYAGYEYQEKPGILLADSDGTIYRIAKDLTAKKIGSTYPDLGFFSFSINKLLLDEGTYPVVPLMNNQGMALLFGNKLQYMLQFYHNPNDLITTTLSLVKQKDKADRLFIFGKQISYFFQIQSNPMFYLQWLVFLLIFGLLYGLFFLSRNIYKKQLLRNQAAEKEVLELQFQSVSNQLNPHFIFNALNAITASIYQENKEDAFKMGARFSSLMRETLSGSEKISRPLENELDFVRNYLELERFRFKNSFDFQIKTDENVDLQSHVPKMIVQTFAENAVKHGLQPLKSGGKLHIHIRQHKETLHISLEDNGVGRQYAPDGHAYSTGNGLKIVEKIIQLYARLKKGEIRYSINDLEENGLAKGTRVEVWVD
jgi:uncharacterized protein YneF (UPF0154 family)